MNGTGMHAKPPPDNDPPFPTWKARVSTGSPIVADSPKSMKRKFSDRNLSPSENFHYSWGHTSHVPSASPSRASADHMAPSPNRKMQSPRNTNGRFSNGRMSVQSMPMDNYGPRNHEHGHIDIQPQLENDVRWQPKDRLDNTLVSTPNSPSNSRDMLDTSNILKEQLSSKKLNHSGQSVTLPAHSRSTRQPIPIFVEPERTIPLKHKDFKECIKKRLQVVETHHSQCVASCIARANVGSVSDHVYNCVNEVEIEQTSPFAGMRPIPSRPASKAKLSRDEQVLSYHVPYETHSKGDDTNVVYHTKSYTASTHVVPPYTHYISSKSNVLVEGVRNRTFLPYLGEDEENLDEEYKALQEKILANQDIWRDLMDGEEFGSIWLPYVHSMLSDLGTSVCAVLKVLLDNEATRPPRSLPRELHHLFDKRKEWISEGYYEEEDDSDFSRGEIDGQSAHGERGVRAGPGNSSEGPKRPQKKWLNALANLPEVDDRSLAAAIIACYVFIEDVANFSLWHVVRQTPEAITAAASPKGSTTKDAEDAGRAALHAYVDQACLVCKAHQCFEHGEYSEDKDREDVRVAMTSGLDALSLVGSVAKSAKFQTDKNFSELQDLLGRDASGRVYGEPWNFLSDEAPGLDDNELCSPECFWDLRNRVPEKLRGHWSKEETEMLQTLGSANLAQRRGACAIARMGVIRRSCVEIFNRLIRMIPSKTTDDANRDRSAELHYKNKPWKWWQDNTITWKHEKRYPFRPCNHRDACKNNPDCTCDRKGISCEKSCHCSKNCSRRFRGCQCAARGKPCYQVETCDCFKLNRECDPDVCLTCGVNEVLDPVTRYDESASKGRCCNSSIQKSLPKRTLIGQSKLLSKAGIVGWGLFMGEEVKKGDYIGEYVGEIVREHEAELRGIIYNAINISYLFDLNKAQTLDSTPIGNKLRYINHQDSDFANCKAQVMFCAGVQRIGMFATKNIGIGEELYFDYGIAFTSRMDWVSWRKDGSVIINKATKGQGQTTAEMSDDEDDSNDPRRKNHRGSKPGKARQKALAANKPGKQEGDVYSTEEEDDSDGDDNDEGIASEDDESEDDDDVDDIRSSKQRKKAKKQIRASGAPQSKRVVLANGMSGSDRMRKAWIKRYENLGMSAQAQAQKKKYHQSIKSGKNGSKMSKG